MSTLFNRRRKPYDGKHANRGLPHATTTTFDTLVLPDGCTMPVFRSPRPEVQAAALAEALRQNAGDLVTRGDLKELEFKLEARFAVIRRDMETMQADLLKWIIGLFIAQVGLFAALVKLLH